MEYIFQNNIKATALIFDNNNTATQRLCKPSGETRSGQDYLPSLKVSSFQKYKT